MFPYSRSSWNEFLKAVMLGVVFSKIKDVPLLTSKIYKNPAKTIFTDRVEISVLGCKCKFCFILGVRCFKSLLLKFAFWGWHEWLAKKSITYKAHIACLILPPIEHLHQWKKTQGSRNWRKYRGHVSPFQKLLAILLCPGFFWLR